MATILQEREWGRARESEGKIGQHGVTLKLHVKMSRGAFLLREGRGRGRGGREIPFACITSVTPKEGSSLKGEGHTMRERELPLGEETQKWEKKLPLLSLNLSLMPQGVNQGVELFPHVVPITK
jgi:hypothetical protein